MKYLNYKVVSKSLRVILTIITLLFIVNDEPLKAQSLGGIDLASVRVDDLSDGQILSYMRQAEERGLTQSQLEAIARQRGVSESEIMKLRRRVAQLSKGIKSKGSSIGSNEGLRESTDESRDPLGLDILNGPVPLTEEQQKIFGFELFQNSKLTFSPNLNIPTPENYQLGPGDEIKVDLWGDAQQSLEFTISSEGTIRPENLRPIHLNGLSIEAATTRIIDGLSQTSSGLKGQEGRAPTIFAQVSLGNVRTIQVEVVGNVKQPGTYSLSSLSTIYTALHAAGGPTETGSFRDIRLVRNNKLISTVDIYSYLTDGIKSGDKILRSGDVIVVRPYLSRLEVAGAVKRPGIFEINEKENFQDLMNYTGGFSSNAYKSQVTIKRNADFEKEIVDIGPDQFESFDLKDGDFIEIGEILNRFSNRVIIEGSIHKPGEYQLVEGLTLKALITKAGGLQGDAFLERATIYRMSDNLRQSVVAVDLNKLSNGDDIILNKEDKIVINSIYDLSEEFYVTLDGEIKEVGAVQYFDEMTVQDAIVLAGGLRESASGSLIEISRRNQNGSNSSTADIINISISKQLGLSDEDAGTILKPFDQIYIRKSPGYSIQKQVTIEGEVLAPGKYTIQNKEERISDLLKRAKGLTPYAFSDGAILIRKTEFVKQKSDSEVNLEYIQQLRERLLNADSTLSNYGQARLMERLDKIEKKVLENTTDDQIGSEIKKDLLEDLSAQDSTVREIEIEEEEPVAIDLDLIIKNPGSKYDLILRPDDVISIPGKLETVRIAGEVISPLNVRHDTRLSFKDYINDAGGFTATAQKGRSYVQYPNGRRKQTKRFLWFKFYPRVEPGSTIFVSKKVERNGLGPQGWLAIGSGLATIGLVTIQAIQLIQN